MILTGDTLFVGDVGRPDFGGADAAGQLCDSPHGKILTLPDHIEVYSAHISGSPCGRAMSGKPSSTIGFERHFNEALQEPDRARFMRGLFEGLPAKAAEFEDIITRNRAG